MKEKHVITNMKRKKKSLLKTGIILAVLAVVCIAIVGAGAADYADSVDTKPSVDPATKEINPEDSFTLTAKDFVGEVTWSISNSTVVSIVVNQDNTCTVTGIGTGSVLVGAVGKDSANVTVEATCTVTVVASKNFPVTSIKLGENTLELNINDEHTLGATVYPEYATDKTVTWSSSDNNVATVDQNGKVKGIADGTATITATATDGSGCTGSCAVAVGTGGSYDCKVNVEGIRPDDLLFSSTAATYTPITLPATIFQNIVGKTTIKGKYEYNTEAKTSTLIFSKMNGETVEETYTVYLLKHDGNEYAQYPVLGVACGRLDGIYSYNLDEDISFEVSSVKNTILLKLKKVSIQDFDCNTELGDDNYTTYNVAYGETLNINIYDIWPDEADDKSFTWSSDNTTVATIDQDGKVTFHSPGFACFTVVFNGAGYGRAIPLDLYYIIQVIDSVQIENVILNKTETTLSMVGDSRDTLAVTALVPSYCTGGETKTINWASDDEKVVIVDTFGNLTPMGSGNTTITARVTAGGIDVETECNVTVQSDPLPVETVTLNPTVLNLTSGGSKASLEVTVGPSTASYKTVTWSSSDDSVATVDQNGEVTPHAAGDATITATATDGSGTKATCSVHVTGYTVTYHDDTGTNADYPVADVSLGNYNLLDSLPTGWQTPNGKVLNGWTVGGVTKNLGDTIQVSDNVTATAIWIDNPGYSLTLNTESGAVSYNPAGPVAGVTCIAIQDGKLVCTTTSDSVTVTPTAGSGKALTGVWKYYINNQYIADVTGACVDILSDNYSVTAVTESTTSTVTVNAGENGKVQKGTETATASTLTLENIPSGTEWFSENNILTIGSTKVTATPNRGFEFASWSPASGTVTADTTITANFVAETSYTVSMPDYAYGNAPDKPDISPEPPITSTVGFYVSTVESGEGTLWTQENGNNLGAGTYYIYAKVDGDETTRSSFNVTKATQNPPSSSFSINANKQPVTVKIPGVDKNKSLEYSLDGGSSWTDVNLDETNSFTLTSLEQNTGYTLLLRVQETANYYPSDAVSQNFTTPDETPVVTLTYNGNGGSGAPDKVQVKKGTEVAIDGGSTVTRSGYKFTGWYTSGQQKVSGSMTLNEDVTLYAGWEAATYTVFFEKNGGEGTMDSQTLTTGVKDALHSNTFTRSGYNFAGWAVTATGPVAYTDKQEVSNIANGDSLTLYAVWMNEPTYSISGNVTGEAGSTVSLKLMYGASVIDTATCTLGSDGTGSYRFGKEVPNGIYDVVATDGEKTVTKMVVIEDASKVADIKITEVNSVVEVKDTNNTPPVVVGGLDEEAENYKEEGKKVTITLTVESKVKADAPAGESEEAKKEQEVQKAIDKLEKSTEVSGSNASYIDLSVMKEVKVGSETESKESISKTNTVMELNIPYDFTGKKNVGMVRYHNDKVQKLNQLGNAAEYPDGTYILDKGNSRISLYSDSFSVYAITYDEDTPTPATTGSSSTVTSFTGDKNGNDFTFSNAVVITKVTLPDASYAKVTNTSGSGWYNCTLSTDGTGGVAYFQVPLDVITVKGWTVNDVSMLGCRTTYLTTENGYAKYSAAITGNGPYTIDFEKGAAGTVVTTTQGYLKVLSTPAGATIQIDGVDYIGYTPQEKIALNPGTYQVTLSLDGYEDAVKTVIISDDATSTVTADLKQKSGTTATTTAKSPFPVLGILAGIGVAAVLLRRK